MRIGVIMGDAEMLEVSRKTGHVNLRPFMGYPSGTLMIWLGCSQEIAKGTWKAIFYFHALDKNRTCCGQPLYPSCDFGEFKWQVVAKEGWKMHERN